MNEKFEKILNIVGVYLGAGFLAYILAPLGGMFHSSFINSRCDGGGMWLSPDNTGCVIDGFIYFFIFLLAIFSFSVLSKKTAWKVYITGTFLFWFFSVWGIIDSDKYDRGEYIGSLIIMLGAFALGYLSALGIKWLIRKMKGEEQA